jgi:plastocyanin
MALVSAFAMPSLLGSSVAVAQDGPPPMPANCGVIAQGLLNPRGISVAEDGTIYVIEAGDGGEEAIFPMVGEGTPAPAESLTNRGGTGQVTKIAPDGTASVLATGLTSHTFGTEVVGPSGGVLVDGILYVTVGGPGPAIGVIEPGEFQNKVVAIDTATGEVTIVADINAYEIANNPDPYNIDSNIDGIAHSNGDLYVADAGGNTVYKVNIASGEISVFAVIPGIPAPGMANPGRGGAEELDPVPTSVYVNEDGSVIVGVLSGGPFPPGAAGYYTVAADGTVGDYTAGLTMVMGIDRGPDGLLYATSFASDLIAGNPFGSVTRVNEDGSLAVVVPGLFLGAGIGFSADGHLLTLAMSSMEPGTPASGVLLSCDISDAAVASALEAAAAMAGGGGEATPEAQAAAATTEFAVEAIDIAYDVKSLEIPANTDVTITITNNGVAVHDFNIEGTDIASGFINGGGSTATVTVNLAPGEYTFFCSVPGHRAAGMVGTLTVK